MNKSNSDILGTWHLNAYLFRSVDDEESHPFGADVRGQLTYTEDGQMSVLISFGPSQRFEADEQVAGTDKEKLTAFDAFSAYCGRYERGEHCITHFVEISLFPNWIGTAQQRTLELRDKDLILSMPPRIINGISQTVEARWSRRI